MGDGRAEGEGSEGGNMKLRNTTSLSSDYLREIVRFCKPPGVFNFLISFKGRKRPGIGGRAWRFRYCARVDIGAHSYPARYPGGRGYLPVLVLSEEEALVYVVAHELRHLYQYRNPRGRRVWGTRRSKRGVSERDASAYGIRKVREWRRTHAAPSSFSRIDK
jgi:hypothetical protein